MDELYNTYLKRATIMHLITEMEVLDKKVFEVDSHYYCEVTDKCYIFRLNNTNERFSVRILRDPELEKVSKGSHKRRDLTYIIEEVLSTYDRIFIGE